MYKHEQEKKVSPVQMTTKDFFNLDYPEDRRAIELFEKNLMIYNNQQEVVFGKTLQGFELLCYKNNFVTYSKKYQLGAVVEKNLAEYRIAIAKYHAYGALCDIRQEAKKEDELRLQSLIKNNAEEENTKKE